MFCILCNFIFCTCLINGDDTFLLYIYIFISKYFYYFFSHGPLYGSLNISFFKLGGLNDCLITFALLISTK